jgi:hypothetical protein
LFLLIPVDGAKQAGKELNVKQVLLLKVFAGYSPFAHFLPLSGFAKSVSVFLFFPCCVQMVGAANFFLRQVWTLR